MMWDAEFLLPLVFAGLMALSMLIYVILDGYDLGVGVLLLDAEVSQQDRMIAAIGPFWDANETWLILGVGILLVAFPIAHGVVLTALYFPVFTMLIGLILRGVAFDFRVKARAHHQRAWTRAFALGSIVAGFSQGIMLGQYLTGFRADVWGWVFSLVVGACVLAGYSLLGAGWVILKCEDELRLRAFRWARNSLWLTALGVGAVSIATPWVSARIFEKWFSFPNLVFLAPIPLLTGVLFISLYRHLRRREITPGKDWKPFFGAAGIFLLAFVGLAYSVFPYVVIDRLDIWDAAAATSSLWFMFVGAVIVLPAILGYTIFSYRVFSGKAQDLRYD